MENTIGRNGCKRDTRNEERGCDEVFIKKVDLDTKTPVDVAKAVRDLSSELYYKMLPEFETNGFLENLFYIAFCVQVGNFEAMMQKAHSIKGSGGYAGASRVCEDCYWIQYSFERRAYVDMMKYYLRLVEHSAQFRIHWRKRYFEHLGTTYVEKPDHCEVPLPFGWSLERVADEEFKVYYPDDYLSLALEAERSGKKYIKKQEDKIHIEYDNLSQESLPFPSSRSYDGRSSVYKSFETPILPLHINQNLAPNDVSDLDALNLDNDLCNNPDKIKSQPQNLKCRSKSQLS
ncbi:unnamed protein product [Moneuplotes crassus]|uniref:Uncharacterized protein n=1 Tax=Euplotes crassus TaxID=5936 RepID=A0AAD1XYH8_EUPCR|nr:unnamed protein product [Moneuplotes crassus]